MNTRTKIVIRKEFTQFKREGRLKWISFGVLLVLGVQLIYILNDIQTSKIIGGITSLLLTFGIVQALAPVSIAGEKESGTLKVLLTEATYKEVFWGKVLFISIISLAILTLSFFVALIIMLFTGIWLYAILLYVCAYFVVPTLAIIYVVISAKSRSVNEAFWLSYRSFIIPALPFSLLLFLIDFPYFAPVPLMLQAFLFIVVYKFALKRFEDVERLVCP